MVDSLEVDHQSAMRKPFQRSALDGIGNPGPARQGCFESLNQFGLVARREHMVFKIRHDFSNATDVGSHDWCPGGQGFDHRHRSPFVVTRQKQGVGGFQDSWCIVSVPEEVDPGMTRSLALELDSKRAVPDDGEMGPRMAQCRKQAYGSIDPFDGREPSDENHERARANTELLTKSFSSVAALKSIQLKSERHHRNLFGRRDTVAVNDVGLLLFGQYEDLVSPPGQRALGSDEEPFLAW